MRITDTTFCARGTIHSCRRDAKHDNRKLPLSCALQLLYLCNQRPLHWADTKLYCANETGSAVTHYGVVSDGGRYRHAVLAGRIKLLPITSAFKKKRGGPPRRTRPKRVRFAEHGVTNPPLPETSSPNWM